MSLIYSNSLWNGISNIHPRLCEDGCSLWQSRQNHETVQDEIGQD